MPTDTKLNNLIINYLTQAQYDAIQTPNENELYLTPDNSTGGGVSPCLNLMNMEEGSIRTSITEEEYNNIKKGLYNSVLYADISEGAGAEFSMYFPETAVYVLGDFGFSAYNISVDEASSAITISGSSMYAVHIGDKNADGTYPIAITKETVANFGSGGGSSTPSTSIAFQDVTVAELANHVGEFGNFHITNLKYTYTLGSYTQTYTGAYFIGTVASGTEISGSLWFTVSENTATYIDSKTFSISNNTITYELGKQSLGAIKSISWPLNINSTTGFDLLWNTIDGGDVIYAGDVNGKTTASYLALAYTSIYPSAEREETFARLTGLFKEFGYGVMELKKDANNIPQFKSFTTWLPPVTTDSEGKALIVTSGNAQWTTTPRYEHTITIKNSAGKILWTQTMRNSSNTVVNSYANLKTLFGEATYAGFGEYCQLNLHGGTEETDKLIKADGTEVTLASLGAIVYTDDCFLSK